MFPFKKCSNSDTSFFLIEYVSKAYWVFKGVIEYISIMLNGKSVPS